MKIIINDNRKIADIQEEFHKNFPYLKLVFFSQTHEPKAGTSRVLMQPANKTVGECRTKHNKGIIEIEPGMSVMQLEQHLNNIFGLGVQVFRQSGRVWLETTITDSWTLEEQNQQGEALSKITG
ncbi:MAG TPA: hypothetical protein VLB84_20815 [Bacteroidia bacterium]|nr:hypothetical protein [Bacteroidia bacterium]